MRIAVLVLLLVTLPCYADPPTWEQFLALVDADGDGQSTEGDAVVAQWCVDHGVVTQGALLAGAIIESNGLYNVSSLVPITPSLPVADEASEGQGVAVEITYLEYPAATFEPDVECMFVRGNTNSLIAVSTNVDTSDGVYLLSYLFSGGAPPPNPDSADVNDDGRVDISDAVGLLNYLFGAPGSQPPSFPFPTPGYDPTYDSLDLFCDANNLLAISEAELALYTAIGFDPTTVSPQRFFNADLDGDGYPVIAMLVGGGLVPMYEFAPIDNTVGGEFLNVQTLSGVTHLVGDDLDLDGVEELILARNVAGNSVVSIYTGAGVLSQVPTATYTVPVITELHWAPFGLLALHQTQDMTLFVLGQPPGTSFQVTTVPLPVVNGTPIVPAQVYVEADANGEPILVFETQGGGQHAIDSSGQATTAPIPDWRKPNTRKLFDPNVTQGPEVCCPSAVPDPNGEAIQLNFLRSLVEAEKAAAAFHKRSSDDKLVFVISHRAYEGKATFTLPNLPAGATCPTLTVGLGQQAFSYKHEAQYTGNTCKEREKTVSSYLSPQVQLWDHTPGVAPLFYHTAFKPITPNSTEFVSYQDAPALGTELPAETIQRFKGTIRWMVRALLRKGPGLTSDWFELANRPILLSREVRLNDDLIGLSGAEMSAGIANTYSGIRNPQTDTRYYVPQTLLKDTSMIYEPDHFDCIRFTEHGLWTLPLKDVLPPAQTVSCGSISWSL